MWNPGAPGHPDRLAGLLPQDVQVGLPHIAASEFQAGRLRLPQDFKELREALLRAVLGHPQETLHPPIDLVHQRQVLVAPLPLDLVYANRLQPLDLAMRQAPQNRVFYRSKHLLPGRAEDLGGLFPGEPFGPPRQEPAIALGERAFAVSPGNFFHGHTAVRAAHSPHRVHEVHRNGPQRDELESPRRQTVVTGPRPPAARTDRPPVGPWLDRHFDHRATGRIVYQAVSAVHERLAMFDPIEDSF